MELQLKNRELKTVIILSLLALILVVPDFVSASILGSIEKTIVGSLQSVLFVVLGFVLNITGFITGALLALAMTIFNWVASPNFISLSYTNPAGNPFLAVGWGLTRGLANIVFIIALVVIGIGTILRISSYQMQKTLPVLIIIALLVNFTPVICGLIVDASNIVMNFFMTSVLGAGNPFAATASRQAELLNGIFSNLDFWNEGQTPKAIAALGGSLAIISFNIIAMVIYLLFAVLLIIRYVAIWLLVILSPFAFACYILPRTRGVWNMWWKNFIQWSILGVIMGFFLFLANNFISIMADPESFSVKGIEAEIGGVPSPGLSGILNYVVPWFIPIILLMVGLFASISGAPAAAQTILRAGEKAIKQGARAAGRATAGAAKGIPAVSRAELRARRRMERIPLLGRALGGPGGTSAALAKERAKAGEALKGREPTEIREKISAPAFTREDRIIRAKGMEMLAEKGAFQELDRNILHDAHQYGANVGDVTERMPHWAPDVNETVDARIQRIAADRARRIQAEALTHNDVVQALRQDQIHDFTEHGSVQQKQNIVNTIRNMTGAVRGPFAPVPPGPGTPIAGVNRDVINYIAAHQATGRWPT